MLDIFFFNDTATTEISTLSLHDALPISQGERHHRKAHPGRYGPRQVPRHPGRADRGGEGRALPEPHLRGRVGVLRRSEEHTSELQSRQYLVCRLLLEKNKTSLHYSSSVF